MKERINNQFKKNWKLILFLFFIIGFWIFVIGLFTNWFGFYRYTTNSSVFIDCGKKENSSSRYCDGEFDEYQYDKMDDAGRIINP